MILKRLLMPIVLMLAMMTSATAVPHRFTLVIDAGHGGRDAGAIGSFSKEKNINLKVALAFGRLVERNFPDVRVVYTRKTDVFVTLNERANIANRAKADLFVSVHTNALPKGRAARGFEVYTLGMHRAADNLDVAKRENSVILVEKDYKQHYQGFDPNSSESYIMFEFIQDKNMAKSVELARMIQQEVCSGAGRPNKGVHQAGFLVLRATSMPSCLVELGFITTADEERLLNSESGIDGHARGLYRAFSRYKKKYDTAIVVPYKAPKADAQATLPQIVPQDVKDEQARREKQRAKEQAEAQAKLEKQREQERAEAKAKKEAEERRRAEEAAREQARREQQQQEENAKRAAAAEQPPMSTIAALPAETTAAETAATEAADDRPVFKVQILASARRLNKGDSRLKGCSDADYYTEGGMHKYTMGASTDYNEIYRLRRSLLDKFPEAFIIAFRNGAKTDVREAIRDFRNNKNR